MKFIRLIDSNRVIVCNDKVSTEDYQKGLKALSRLYVISNESENAVARVSDIDDGIIVFDIEKGKLGVKEFNVICDINLDASSEEIEYLLDLFALAYESRN